MVPSIDERIGEMFEMRNKVCERLPLNHPFQPQIIQPLNMVVPDEVNVEPSSSQPPSTNQTQDTTVIYNLVSHYSGELPEVRQSSGKASEEVSMEIASESPQQQAPNPHIASTISSDHVTSPEQVSTTVHKQNTPEYIVPEQYIPGQILTPSIPETISEPDNIITLDATDMEIEKSVSTVVI
jgi:hypothetical protein